MQVWTWVWEGPYHKGRVNVLVYVLARERIFVHVAVYGYFIVTFMFTSFLHLSVLSYLPRGRSCRSFSRRFRRPHRHTIASSICLPVRSVVYPVVDVHTVSLRPSHRPSCCRRPSSVR